MARRLRCRRILLLATLLLLGGALVNVALAWAFAFGAFGKPTQSIYSREDGWFAPVPASWPEAGRCFAVSQVGKVDSLTMASGGYMQEVLQSGWPRLSMRGWTLSQFEGGPPSPAFDASLAAAKVVNTDKHLFRLADRRLPLRPMWPGFAVNTLLYAAALGGLVAARALIIWPFRRRRGGCPSCGYDVRGLRERVCPECGAAF